MNLETEYLSIYVYSGSHWYLLGMNVGKHAMHGAWG